MPKISWRLLLLIFIVTVLLRWSYSCYSERISRDYQRHYIAAKTVVAGENPYLRKTPKFKYPLFNAILLSPLSFFNIYLSQSLWFGLCVVLILGICSMTGALLGREKMHFPLWLWLIPIFISARFFWMNLKLGQINTLVFYFTVLGLYLMDVRNKKWIGGGFIGLASVMKYMPILFIFYFALKKRWKECLGMLLGFIVCFFIIPVMFLGVRKTIEYSKDFFSQGTERVEYMVSKDYVVGQSIHSLLYSLLTPVDVSNKGVSGDKLDTDIPLNPDDVSNKDISGDKLDTHTPVYINLLNVEASLAKTAARLFCLAVIIGAGCFLWKQRNINYSMMGLPKHIWEYGLVLMIMLIISPEARKAQFLTTYIPYAASLTGYFILSQKDSKKANWFLILIILSQILMWGTSRKFVGKDLEKWFNYYSSVGWSAVILAIAMIFGLLSGKEKQFEERK
ncbi:MAG TPA: glycosyltransferase family 87 protein [Candidatus Sumerlaeota bacterium]|nr:MAG: hypothetical protein BWY12_00774 [candidate division BRC1 bacterium ADurb.Bin183]HOE63208.1 glycosyltransferase family 87 protein [Candidatus Sumerlaeota bacterium]HRR30890.1 glycosyltransferase family 87 protein [Candidatus Sumerlaeia bacterium]HON50566.1 glycosyltransferase family 87 protein [Candidatus Sumerlaeota bacterium]HOR65388.1 glycosyltransferase family 87 protein [Candidatus Sumerlaeota bacterium]